jgi:integrase/recombinase XerC
MDRLLKSFINHLRFELNLSSHTIRAYKSDIEDFFAYLLSEKIKPEGANFDPDAVDQLNIRGFLGSLLDRKLQNVSINRKLSSLRNFFDYLISEGHTKNNPAKQTNSPKIPIKTAEFLSIDDINYLFDSALQDKTPLGIRNRNIYEVLYGTGIRVGELVSLDLEDIKMEEKILYVKGKGRKDRIVPFGKKCKEALIAYLDVREELKKRSKKPRKTDVHALFLNKLGRRLSSDGVRFILKTFLKKITLQRKVTPHTFRHTTASHLLDSGADLMVVKELLGHEDLATTQKYTHITIDKLMREYDKAHPRGKHHEE